MMYPDLHYTLFVAERDRLLRDPARQHRVMAALRLRVGASAASGQPPPAPGPASEPTSEPAPEPAPELASDVHPPLVSSAPSGPGR